MSKALAGCNTSGHGDASDAGAMSKNVKMKTEETFSGIVIDLEGSNSLMPPGPPSQFESPKPKRVQDNEPTGQKMRKRAKSTISESDVRVKKVVPGKSIAEKLETSPIMLKYKVHQEQCRKEAADEAKVKVEFDPSCVVAIVAPEEVQSGACKDVQACKAESPVEGGHKAMEDLSLVDALKVEADNLAALGTVEESGFLLARQHGLVSVSLKEAHQLAQETNSTLADAAELLLTSADISGEPGSMAFSPVEESQTASLPAVEESQAAFLPVEESQMAFSPVEERQMAFSPVEESDVV